MALYSPPHQVLSRGYRTYYCVLIAITSMGTSTIITRSATANDYYPVHSCMYSAVCTQQLHSTLQCTAVALETLDSHSPLPWRGVEHHGHAVAAWMLFPNSPCRLCNDQRGVWCGVVGDRDAYVRHVGNWGRPAAPCTRALGRACVSQGCRTALAPGRRALHDA